MSCDLLVVGGEGDLALRKLYPALYSLWVSDCLPRDIRIFGMARRPMTQPDFLARVREWFDKRHKTAAFEEAAWADFTSRLTYCSLDATSAEALSGLRERALNHADRDLVVYLATPPGIFGPVCEAIAQAGLVRDNTRIVVEKPLGEDRESYLAINSRLTRIFHEDQVYRIDHYLG
ncbi:MAG: glucose-6-phosphate dehydrogenase, partial [Halioglobus sp.]|nr:glucose-6-phosphate dehydrogenase [Halioglobus sp.]